MLRSFYSVEFVAPPPIHVATLYNCTSRDEVMTRLAQRCEGRDPAYLLDAQTPVDLVYAARVARLWLWTVQRGEVRSGLDLRPLCYADLTDGARVTFADPAIYDLDVARVARCGVELRRIEEHLADLEPPLLAPGEASDVRWARADHPPADSYLRSGATLGYHEHV